VVFRQSAVTSVVNRENFKRISMYPNPLVKGTDLQMNFTNQTAGRYEMRVYNLLGLQIFTKTLQHNGGTATQTVKMPSSLTSGIYIVEMVNEKGMVQKQKINIQ
jgi:hypothetical protein